MSFKDDIAKLLAWTGWIERHADIISRCIRRVEPCNNSDFDRQERDMRIVRDRLSTVVRRGHAIVDASS